ncbi:MAG: PIG-L family deacetylase [Planctomycetes bacterium]|nr:PIG-L family deacetylase [Planctomycetota bacterium]
MSFRPPELPDIVLDPPRGPVLVVAPHPDDEMMGPGGTLILHARAGDPISIVVVCDGSLGDPDGQFPREGYTDRRERETREVAQRFLATDDVHFFRFADGITEEDVDKVYPNLPPDPDDKRRALVHGLSTHLRGHVQRVRRRVGYYPWAGEFHAAHWGCGMAMENLMTNEPALFEETDVLGYEVWSTLVPDTLVDVTSTFETKLEAIRCYETQTHYVDYSRVVGGLNLYRGMLIPGPELNHAEAFKGKYRGGRRG